MRDDAAGRWRAGIVIDEVSHVASADMIANVISSDNGDAVAFAGRHARTINSGAKAGAGKFIDPRSQIRVIVFRQPATFFDIKKNDRV